MFNQNFVYPYLNNYRNSNGDTSLINQQELYRHASMPSLFTPTVGFDNGNLFSNLYNQYKDFKPASVTADNEREAMMRELSRMAFAAHELNLYLDLHPDDTSMIALFNDYREKAVHLMKEYDRRFGPLSISSNNLNQTPFMWQKDAWPWEVMPDV